MNATRASGSAEAGEAAKPINNWSRRLSDCPMSWGLLGLGAKPT